jgi:hypothetical protein
LAKKLNSNGLLLRGRLELGGNYRLARTKCSLIFPCMGYKPPTVNLPMPPEKIDGQTVTFRPVRDGIDLEVSGVLQVIEDANGFNVNASYIVSENPSSLAFIGSISLRSMQSPGRRSKKSDAS